MNAVIYPENIRLALTAGIARSKTLKNKTRNL